MVSLCYLIIYLLNNKAFTSIIDDVTDCIDQLDLFKKYRDMKEDFSAHKISQMIRYPSDSIQKRASFKELIGEFCEISQSLNFDEKPNYQELKEILRECQKLPNGGQEVNNSKNEFQKSAQKSLETHAT